MNRITRRWKRRKIIKRLRATRDEFQKKLVAMPRDEALDVLWSHEAATDPVGDLDRMIKKWKREDA